MNKTTTHNSKTAGNIFLIFGFSVAVAALINLPLHADDALDKYYRDILFNPGKPILTAESRGRVTIYDGIESSIIDEAMDSQFDRIENMMFVGIKHILPDGQVEVEDDGCDD